MTISMQKSVIKLKRAFQNKKRTCFNETSPFNKFLPNLYTPRIWQNYVMHQRRSKAAVRRRFTKQVSLKIMKNLQECFCAGVVFYRSSCLEIFCRKGFLRNFAKFTGKHLCQSLFFTKVAGLRLRPATLVNKRLWHRYFPVNFGKFLRTSFFTEHLRWLLFFLIRLHA